jgi:hypothetical protein
MAKLRFRLTMGTNPLGLGIEMACRVLAIYRSLRGLPREAVRLLRGDQKRMSTEADTCRKYVVPICLGGGGSLFCGLKTFLPRRSRAKAGAFSISPCFRLNAPQRRQPTAIAAVCGLTQT